MISNFYFTILILQYNLLFIYVQLHSPSCFYYVLQDNFHCTFRCLCFFVVLLKLPLSPFSLSWFIIKFFCFLFFESQCNVFTSLYMFIFLQVILNLPSRCFVQLGSCFYFPAIQFPFFFFFLHHSLLSRLVYQISKQFLLRTLRFLLTSRFKFVPFINLTYLVHAHLSRLCSLSSLSSFFHGLTHNADFSFLFHQLLLLIRCCNVSPVHFAIPVPPFLSPLFRLFLLIFMVQIFFFSLYMIIHSKFFFCKWFLFFVFYLLFWQTSFLLLSSPFFFWPMLIVLC